MRVELFLRTKVLHHRCKSYAASGRPAWRGIRLIRKLANSWQNGFWREAPQIGEN
jgi:hypothetical protein